MTEPRLQWIPSLLRGSKFSFFASFVVSEPLFLRLFLQKADMAIRVGRGAGRRRLVTNVEVLGMLQRVEARMDAMERRQPRDPEDISEPETEEAEENVEIPPDMRLLRTVLGSAVKPRIEVSSYAGGLNPE